MVRVYLRGPATGTGTGTGGGTGGGSSTGGYDRYIGTLGAVANKPADSKFTHYETFPAAEKYDWVRVVTTSTINGVSVIEGQEWICNTKTGKDLSANWEVRSNSVPFSQFGSLDGEQYVGSLGTAEDAPVGAKKPHYTEFPAANKGNWLQVRSTFKVANQELYQVFLVEKGQAWLCIADNSQAEDPTKWEKIQETPVVDEFLRVLYYFIGRYDFFVFETNKLDTLALSGKNSIESSYKSKGAFNIDYFNLIDITKIKNFFASYGYGSVFFDFDIVVVFEKDSNGDRSVRLDYESYVVKNDNFTNNKSEIIDKSAAPAVREDETIIKMTIYKFPIVWHLPSNPADILNHYLRIVGYQSSGIFLKIKRLSIAISANKAV